MAHHEHEKRRRLPEVETQAARCPYCASPRSRVTHTLVRLGPDGGAWRKRCIDCSKTYVLRAF